MNRIRLPALAILLSFGLITAPGRAAVRPSDIDGTRAGTAGTVDTRRFISPATWFVELSSLPLAESDPSQETKNLRRLRKEKDVFRQAAAQAGLHFRERFSYDRLWNGLSVEIDPIDLPILAAVPGVAAIYPVMPVEQPETILPVPPGESLPELMTAVTMTGADRAQELGYTGAGVKVAIIDTGVDYIHPDLGGGFGPGFKVEGGYDLVGNNYSGPGTLPIPDPDPRDCQGHGTHVSGIVGADGQVRGVAPGARLRVYRVFGCEGGTEADVILAAMERVFLDDNQVVNLSLGATFQWARYPTARAADLLVSHGVVVVASAGNSGQLGIYSMSSPAIAPKAIAVASVDNLRVHTRALRPAGGPLIGYLPINQTPDPPLSGSALIKDVGQGCNTDRALFVGLAGKIALMRRGGCDINAKLRNVRNASAVAGLVYNDQPGIFVGQGPDPPVEIPAGTLAREDGLYLADRARFSISIAWTDQFADAPVGTGGLVSTFSSAGPGPDLDLKPDVAAPGAFIFSTLPLTLGRYGLASGTSMSSPHVAGAAALMLEAFPHTPAIAMGDLLRNSASPRRDRSSPTSGRLEMTWRQGAGMIDLPAALSATLRARPGRISLGEMEGGEKSATVTLENRGDSSLVIDAGNLPAAGAAPDDFHTVPLDGAAAVRFSPTPLVVPAGGTASLVATFAEPAPLPEGSLFGGFLVLSPRDGGRSIQVPYAGVKGDYQSRVVLNPEATPYGNPVLTADLEFFRPNDPLTIDPRAGQRAWVVFRLDHPVRRLRIELFEADTGRRLGRLLEANYFPRSPAPDSFYLFAFAGTADQPPDTSAVYRLQLSVEKALGDDDNPAHWESWLSAPLTVLH